ncbi:MAG: SdiA-regulated domain-containing protein [Saprospiraceae bacterium]|nr:SdiA-regulated domain-containing protein [Saprospiraceae bacterium]
MMNCKFIGIALLVFITSSGCFLDNKIDQAKNNEIKPEAFNVYQAGITGFSGICPGKVKDTFLAVSDKTGIFEIDKVGKIIRKLPFSGSYDFEGITINPATNEVYLADEGQMKIYKLSNDEKSIELITDVRVTGGVINKGIEGLTYGNDTLYIVNQESPTIMIKYDLKSRKETARLAMNYVQFLSDIYYDGSDKTLWISDSKQQKFFHTDLNGNVIAFQSIPYIAKAEAITVDRVAKIAWIGCDETGFLYKVRLEI